MDAISQKERRVITRLPANSGASVRLHLGENHDILADVQDISISGIGIRTQQPLEPGTSVLLEPVPPNLAFSSELRAEVKHARKCPDDGYFLGCSFSRYLTIDDTMVLG